MTHAVTNDTVQAWHWVRGPAPGILRDGTQVTVGDWLPPIDSLVLCARGYHGSEDIMDAIKYAPGLVVCRVELGGQMVRGDDKIVASQRRVLWSVDATDAVCQWVRRLAAPFIGAAKADKAAAEVAEESAALGASGRFWPSWASWIAGTSAAMSATESADTAVGAACAVEAARNAQRTELLRLIEEAR